MIYVLILVLSQYQNPAPIPPTEFRGLAECRAAAAEVAKQLHAAKQGWEVHAAVCAITGKQP